jgi:hypothetical protein
MQVSDEMIDAALDAYNSVDNAPFAPPVDCMRAALEAALSAMWQDISTAPKDGTKILVWPYWPDNIPAAVYWRDMKRTPGRWEITPSHFCFGADPTRWQPLPPPPKIEGQEGK